MKFGTKEDLIKKYASKRKNISEQEVEDLLNSVIGYFNKEVGAYNTTEVSYRLNNFGTLYNPDFDTSKLIENYKEPQRIRAEKQLIEYILTGNIIPKKLNIQNDKVLRI
jgi:hypothetical protein